jgi:hypothetical protein
LIHEAGISYATVSEAIDELYQQGFTTDFNLEENYRYGNSEKLDADKLETKEIYRYEGNSDPVDEATVYGLQSKTGLKGVLVTGYGISTDNFSSAILNKLITTKDWPFCNMNGTQENKTIWTIGHSTRTLNEFIDMLKSFQIEVLADIRSFPGSRKFPHFNKEALKISLPQKNIRYIHFKNLGGRRKAKRDSRNTAWRNAAFRGYADYMETENFREGASELEKMGIKNRTAFMCSEAVWWRCHRSMVSDYLKVQGWKVMHILSIGKEEEHAYTVPARIVNAKLSYENEADKK